jgi:hypothetical protein
MRDADVPCTITKVTPDGTTLTGDDVRASADGTRVVFETGASSIALVDTEADTVEVIASAREPAISADGTFIAYRDLDRVVYRRGFASGSLPLAISGDLTQSGDVGPSISGNGGFVAFRSLGHPDTDEGPAIWRWRVTGDLRTELFSTEDDDAFLSTPIISRENSTVTFTSDANISGGNPDRNLEVFRWSGSVVQVTVSNRDNRVQDINSQGDVFAINSQANWAGDNADGNTELFLFDLRDPPTQIEQVTDIPFPAVGAGGGSLDETGDLVAFRSNRDHGANGAPLPANELFVHRAGVATHRLTDAPTSFPDVLTVPEVTGDGSTVIVGSTRDFGGLNPDNSNEVFAFECAIPSFRDVPVTHTFFEEIEWLAGSGVTGGFADHTFRPGLPVTRQAMAAFLYRMVGSPEFDPPETPSFDDVPLSHPFFPEIEWLADSGVGGGFPDGTFRPTASVSRQAMAAFLFRLVEPVGFVPPGTPSFLDVPLSHTFYEEIEWLVDEGVATGFPDDTFKPGAAVSRQAMAAFLFRLQPLL